MTISDPSSEQKFSRRSLLQKSAGTAALLGLPAIASAVHAAPEPSDGKLKGRIKQSIVHWCFAEHWNIEETAKIAKESRLPEHRIGFARQLADFKEIRPDLRDRLHRHAARSALRQRF